MKRKTNTVILIRRIVAVALMLGVFAFVFAAVYSIVGRDTLLPAEASSQSSLLPGRYPGEQIYSSKGREVLRRSVIGGKLRTAGRR
jgi:hypothetical protein